MAAMARKRYVIGIVGGLCPAAIADIYLKLALGAPGGIEGADRAWVGEGVG